MADNVSIDQDGVGGVDFNAATDEIGGVHYQKIKLVDGTADSTTAVVAGGGVQANALRVTLATDSTGQVKITDGTSSATVRDLAANDALNVAIVDGAGNQITSFSGSGGTSATDDADFTPGITQATPVQGVYEASPTSVTDNDMGIIGIDTNRRVKVTVDASTIDVAHDAADSGNPVKVGSRAVSALPTAVTANDRANQISDLFGRTLVSHIDPAMQVHKGVNYTTTQTGAVIWDPTAGMRIAITSIVIGSYGTTAARLILWFGDNADTAYTAGTDQLVLAASYAPSSTSKPGTVFTPAVPIFCTTANRELHVTTDAGLSVDIAVEGYEW
jgi:hypothetical protein